MGPGDLFVKIKTNKKKNRWKHLWDAHGIIHQGKQLHRVVMGNKAQPTEIYQARCDANLQLVMWTSAGVTCVLCLGAS